MKRNKEKEIKKKLLSTFVVLAMMLTGFAAMFIAGPGVITVQADPNVNEPSVRVYGEENAVYPTQSYYGPNDFVYPQEYDPFDPGIIEKDSITFNPAFLHGHEEFEIKAQGDASEKVFLRAFYEPGYTHPIDSLMDSWSSVTLHPVEEFDGIVTETTYFLTTLDKAEPTVGYPGATKFALPYKSNNATRPGMEVADLVEVVDAFDGSTNQLTDGAIKVEREYEFIGSYVGQTISFFDHEVTFKNFENNDPLWDKLDLDVSYIGNMYKALSSKDTYTIDEGGWFSEHFFDRENNKQIMPDPAHRWYLRIESADDDYLRIALGRWLYAGETFYVDGVRYDMPAVYVDNDGGFKYITLQSPIPKGDPVWDSPLDDNVDDWSHVTSQYLASLPEGDCVWVLPPFYNWHTMVDDIGLDKYEHWWGYNEVPADGLLINGQKGPLCFYYIEEDIEERFDTSLAERLNTTESGDEVWEWYNVYTKPNRYTEFILPNQEWTCDTYVTNDIPSWYPCYYADGNEYLITSSLIAPNSIVDTDRSDNCKVYDEHEIFDRVWEIALYDERIDYYEMPRFVYEFDAVDSTDFYINEDNPRPSVRIYGEEDFDYPTHSYFESNDFVYPVESDPFDPGVISKDSITFNPAFLHGHEDYEIKARGDASEKVFLRAFYEPGYTHPVDTLMDSWSNVLLHPVEEFDGIVTETTYFLTTLDKAEPNVGYPGATKFVLPYKSNDANHPGMEVADLVEVVDAFDGSTNQLTDGAIKVEKVFEFNNIDYTTDIPIKFLDHKVVIKNFEDREPWDKLDLDVSYIGNMYEEAPSTDTHTVWEDSWSPTPSILYFFDRDNDKQTMNDPAHRWFLRIENADDDYLRIALGRWLYAGETFYVDGVRYDMPAVYVDADDGFKYITLQSPLPKPVPISDHTVWYSPLDDNVNDWSHVTSQYLASLPKDECVWVLPPFNGMHTMVDDIGIEKSSCGWNEDTVPLAGLFIKDKRGPLCFKYIDEDIEERFDTSLTERLKTLFTNDLPYDEVWEWYNIYTMPNRYTEFVLPDQEDPEEDTYEVGGYVDGNEYLITSSLIAPNSNVDTDRRDTCKYYDEHEIFSWIGGGGNGGSGFTQLAMLIDSSGSIGTADFTTMKNGIAAAIEDVTVFPHDGSVELTIVKFGSSANLEVNSPIIVDSSNYQTIANGIRNIAYVGGGTAMSSAFSLATTTLSGSSNFDPNDRQIINIVTDGEPNSESATIAARDAMIVSLGMDSDPDDEIDAEAIGSWVDPIWLRDYIVWPQPGTIVTAPPFIPGWVRVIDSFDDFVPAIGEKFRSIFTGMPVPRFVFEFDASDGTGLFINGNQLQVPECDCNGPYVAGVEQEVILLNGCNSYDSDGTLVNYEWIVDGYTVYSGSNCNYYLALGNYNPGTTHTVELCVTDNDGLTSCCDTTLTISGNTEVYPDCDCNGPYVAGVEQEVILLNGCSSYDPDGTIVNYEWKVDGTTVYSGSACSYYLPLGSYNPGTYPVDLCVTDDGLDDGLTSCCSTTLTVRDGECPAEIIMEDICCIPIYGTDSAYLKATGVAEHVGSCDFTISWDPTVVDVINADHSDFESFYYGIDHAAGTLTGVATMTTKDLFLTGNFNIAEIEFEAVGSYGESCTVAIDYSLLLTDDPIPSEVCHTPIDGTVSIEPNGGNEPDGDMNGDEAVNSADVRYLALYLAGDSDYSPLHSDGDVNCDGYVNSADVRYLALYLAGDLAYTPLYPTC